MIRYVLVGSVAFALMTGVSYAQSGTAGKSPAMPHKTHHGAYDAGDRYTDALNFLQTRGYLNVKDLTEDGSFFTAKAWYHDREVTVRLDPSTGTIQDLG
jgi:hypothetical protein